MATLKCKMCGGDLELTPDVTVAECPYCGTKQTVPNADNEKKMTLFSRANRLRFNNEFDKAAGVYETIIGEFPEEAEAYWGLVLCKYGIEYVDDPATAKKIPTCHRSSFDSVMEDENLELAMEYADAVAKRMYREEAKQIEEIRKGILEVSSKEEPYDVFICYKETDETGERTLDSVLAQDIYNELTEKGYRVFFSRITLEDKLGQEYEPYIFAALHSARVMLAVGTSYEHYDAVWVKNEWSRYLQLMAAGEKKTLIPCYKDLDAYDMPKEFAKFQAQDMGKVGAMQDLVRGVEKILGKSGEQNASVADTAASGMAVLNAQTEALLKRGYISLKDRKFAQAKGFFDQVLNNDPECAQAYWGKVLAGRKVRDKEELLRAIISEIEEEASNTDELVEEAVLEPNVPLAALAREADAQTGILSEFTDSELESLLTVEFDVKPICYRKCLSLYELRLENYDSLEHIQSLVCVTDYGKAVQDYKKKNNGKVNGLAEYWQKFKSDYDYKDDYNHAIEYAKGDVLQELEAIWTGVTDWIKGKIEEEKQIPAKWQEEQEKRSVEIKEAVSGWLQDAAGNIAGPKAEAEAAQKKAEEKAEADYQAAVQAAASDYERQLDVWKKEKAAYPTQYDAAVAKQLELQEKIMQLEQEKAQLKGFFTGKKRKELETNIAQLQSNLAAVIMPLDPGEPPVRGDLPKREDFYKNVQESKNRGKIQTAVAVFPSFRDPQLTWEELSKVSVGGIVHFGVYLYKNGSRNKIQWRILDKRENSLLLLTEYGIDVKGYDDDEGWGYKTWKNCTLRKWLNEEFLDETFSDFEKMLIQMTNVDNSQAQGNREWNPEDEQDTQDRVFLLSYKEAAEDYFVDDNARICYPTEYAKSQGAYIDENTGGGEWWLRSPGHPEYGGKAVVSGDGSIIHSDSFNQDSDCIRPALWINLDSAIFES